MGHRFSTSLSGLGQGYIRVDIFVKMDWGISTVKVGVVTVRRTGVQPSQVRYFLFTIF